MLTASHTCARSHAQSHIDTGISNTCTYMRAQSHTNRSGETAEQESVGEKPDLGSEPGLCKNSPAPSNSGSSSLEGMWKSGYGRETRAGGEGVGREGQGVAGRDQGA